MHNHCICCLPIPEHKGSIDGEPGRCIILISRSVMDNNSWFLRGINLHGRHRRVCTSPIFPPSPLEESASSPVTIVLEIGIEEDGSMRLGPGAS
jgi:hypothetical protein